MSEPVLIEVRARCDADTQEVLVGPRDEGDIAVLVREAIAQWGATAERAAGRLEPKCALRLDCTGSFVEGPVGLKLSRLEVATLARANAQVTVQLRRDTLEYERLVRAREPADAVGEYLTPADAVPVVEVLFGIRGPDLPFADVTRRLGLEPSYKRRAKRPFTSSGERWRDQWVLSSGWLRRLVFSDSLDAMLARVTPKAAEVSALVAEFELESSVSFVVSEYGDVVPRLELERRHLNDLVALSAGVWLDIL